MLSFLNPWLWLGALAVAAPIWLHLRRKQETNLVRFSAVRFLEDQPQPRRSPLQLRRLLLLALRLLALLLIVAAFCWPYLYSASTAPVSESRVYILDNTLSHQAGDGFTRDRERVLRELSKAGQDVQVGVVELTSAPRLVVAFADDRETARRKLEALEPSFQRGSYLAAFRQAHSLLANSLGIQKRIIFLGDNQENQWSEHTNTPPFLESVQVELPKPSAAALPNVSVAEPRVQRVFLGDKSLIHFTVKLTHAGPARNAMVTLRANDRTIFSRSVELEQQPETTMLQAQWEADPAAWLRGEVTVEASPDALAGDNRVYFSLPPVLEGKVAVLAQSPYLRLALSPEVMRGQWTARLLDASKLNSELAGQQDADVLCLESAYLQSGEARQLVSRYLTGGRGVLLLVNRLTPVIEQYLHELGLDSQGWMRAAPGSPEKFQFVFSNHAIFHPFLTPDYGNLMDVKVKQYAKLQPTTAMPLVYGEGGAGMFFQGTKFPGKLFVAAFGFDREQTSWPIHQTFIPFLDLTLQAARAEDSSPNSFEPGEVASLPLPTGLAAHEVVLRQERTEIARAAVARGRAQLRMPEKPGLYALTYDEGDRVEKVLSINPSPKESQLKFVDPPGVLRAWRRQGDAGTVKNPPPIRGQVRLSTVLQQRIWWWMVLGGLLALLLEMTWVGASKERV